VGLLFLGVDLAARPYSKDWLSLEQQADLLIGRGLIVSNREALLSDLRAWGYYRFSGYAYPLRESLNIGEEVERFKAESTHDLIRRLYAFDYELRFLLLKELVTQELAVRSAIAYQLGSLGALAHRDGTYSRSAAVQAEWLKKIDERFRRANVGHNRDFQKKYEGFPPVWISVESWTMGDVSAGFSNLTLDLQRAISHELFGKEISLSQSLKFMARIRNKCAHSERLWDWIWSDGIPREQEFHSAIVRSELSPWRSGVPGSAWFTIRFINLFNEALVDRIFLCGRSRR
jgi:abortive infection bacteriophage resistance protein